MPDAIKHEVLNIRGCECRDRGKGALWQSASAGALLTGGMDLHALLDMRYGGPANRFVNCGSRQENRPTLGDESNPHVAEGDHDPIKRLCDAGVFDFEMVDGAANIVQQTVMLLFLNREG